MAEAALRDPGHRQHKDVDRTSYRVREQATEGGHTLILVAYIRKIPEPPLAIAICAAARGGPISELWGRSRRPWHDHDEARRAARRHSPPTSHKTDVFAGVDLHSSNPADSHHHGRGARTRRKRPDLKAAAESRSSSFFNRICRRAASGEPRGRGHQARRREKEIGGSGLQGAHLHPMGLFLRTSIPCIWRILNAFRPA